jgi:SAM-dependent methyltransferase
MNKEHLEFCASETWREALRDFVIPFALADARLGDDVLEVGPGPGLTTELLCASLPKLTALELDEDLAAALRTRLADVPVDVILGDATSMPFDEGRFSGVVSFTMLHHLPTAALQDALFAEVARVLRPGGLFVVSDSIASDDLAAFHHDDVYNPIDPETVADRLTSAGFSDVEVRSNEFGWAANSVR